VPTVCTECQYVTDACELCYFVCVERGLLYFITDTQIKIFNVIIFVSGFMIFSIHVVVERRLPPVSLILFLITVYC